MATAAILGFQKFEILTVGAVTGDSVRHLAKFHQSVKRLQRYGDLTIFKMAAVRHLEF